MWFQTKVGRARVNDGDSSDSDRSENQPDRLICVGGPLSNIIGGLGPWPGSVHIVAFLLFWVVSSGTPHFCIVDFILKTR